jgi:hypothetical protein
MVKLLNHAADYRTNSVSDEKAKLTDEYVSVQQAEANLTTFVRSEIEQIAAS